MLNCSHCKLLSNPFLHPELEATYAIKCVSFMSYLLLLLLHYSYGCKSFMLTLFPLTAFQDPRKLLFATGKSVAKLTEKVCCFLSSLFRQNILILCLHAICYISARLRCIICVNITWVCLSNSQEGGVT